MLEFGDTVAVADSGDGYLELMVGNGSESEPRFAVVMTVDEAHQVGAKLLALVHRHSRADRPARSSPRRPARRRRPRRP